MRRLDLNTRVTKALDVAAEYGGDEGEHHKDWVIDQMARWLLGCPEVEKTGIDGYGQPYTYTALGESVEYRAWAERAQFGPGIAP